MTTQPPVAVLELDLADLPQVVPDLERYSQAWTLIRYRGKPVGHLMLPVVEGEIRPRELRDELIRAAGNDLKSHVTW